MVLKSLKSDLMVRFAWLFYNHTVFQKYIWKVPSTKSTKRIVFKISRVDLLLIPFTFLFAILLKYFTDNNPLLLDSKPCITMKVLAPTKRLPLNVNPPAYYLEFTVFWGMKI